MSKAAPNSSLPLSILTPLLPWNSSGTSSIIIKNRLSGLEGRGWWTRTTLLSALCPRKARPIVQTTWGPKGGWAGFAMVTDTSRWLALICGRHEVHTASFCDGAAQEHHWPASTRLLCSHEGSNGVGLNPLTCVVTVAVSA